MLEGCWQFFNRVSGKEQEWGSWVVSCDNSLNTSFSDFDLCGNESSQRLPQLPDLYLVSNSTIDLENLSRYAKILKAFSQEQGLRFCWASHLKQERLILVFFRNILRVFSLFWNNTFLVWTDSFPELNRIISSKCWPPTCRPLDHTAFWLSDLLSEISAIC